MKVQKFLHLKHSNRTIKVFSTKLNSLAKYALGVDNLDRGKLEVFLGGLRLDIAKDVMIRYNPPRSLSKALGKALRSETVR